MANSAPKIIVAVRKRPTGKDDIVEAAGAKNLVVHEPKVKYDLTKYTESHKFVYDEVMNEKCGNREVYSRCCGPLIETVFSYGNATCFAYGQTGSGKTHTMLGKGQEPGIYACAAHDIFKRANKQGMVVFAAFYEIYGRKLFDLLNDREKLFAREDGNKEIVICGLTEYPVQDIQGLFDLIQKGSDSRAAGQTSANAESSRSHAVLQMEVREEASGKTVGKMSFIDLAGNERGSDTFDCDRRTRMEGAEINKSLLALKECIRALGQGKSHVPFRGSVLTEVLRDSFLGNSRTTMIATISPTASHVENTLNTLRYTQRVKEITEPGGAKKGEGMITPGQKGGGGKIVAGGAKVVKGVNRVGAGGGNGGKRPEWIDNFNEMDNDGGGSDADQGAVPPPPPAEEKPKGGAGRKVTSAGQDKKKPVGKKKWNNDLVMQIPDKDVATIVEKRLEELTDDEVEQDDDDNDDDSGAEGGYGGSNDKINGGGGAGGNNNKQRLGKNNTPQPAGLKREQVKGVKAVHNHLVNAIREGEEEIMAFHRRHVDVKMAIVKEEVDSIKSLDNGDIVIDDYLTKVDNLMARQVKELNLMRDRLGKLQAVLREEELLSRTLTPAAGKGRQPGGGAPPVAGRR